MEGHTNNVSFAVFHPNLPIIISGSEDGTVEIWNSGTYRVENTLSYALERAWCVALRKDANEVAVGFDEGVVIIKLGRDEPTLSMDPSGKLIYTRNHNVLSGNLQTISLASDHSSTSFADGTRIPLSTKEISSTEIFATSLMHSPNGRFVTVVGDGEYITYTALAWRNKSFGNGISFAWAPDSNTYAVLENKVKLKVYKNFKERPGVGMKGAGSCSIESLHGGTLLSTRGNGFVMFWDRETGEIVRWIDVDAKNVFWSGTGSLVAITSDDSCYILRFDRDAYNAKLEEGAEITDEGVEEAFEVIADVADSVKSTKWVGDCFIYTTASNRLATSSAANHTPSVHSTHPFTFSDIYPPITESILRGDTEAAAEILPTLLKDQLNKVARFLEGRDLKELGIQVTTDPDHKFDLALSLDNLDTAVEIARTVPENESEVEWKALSDQALTVWRFDLTKESFEKANDLSALMLLLLAIRDQDGLTVLSQKAVEKGQNNLAFAITLQLGDASSCIDLLVETQRAPEAALFSRTYKPRYDHSHFVVSAFFT
ncbi:coatomer WD associated region-domain-containing protein [Flammula alnicola]|nr:coatomer WD associated region-domain-containing protein [Flammula alnicola]